MNNSWRNRISPRQWTWSTRGLVAAGGLFIVAILVVTSVSFGSDDQTMAGSSEPAITIPSNSPEPLSPVQGIGEHQDDLQEPDYPLVPDCLELLGASEYQAFERQVFTYEEAFLAPPSLDRDAALEPLTTQQYQRDHTGLATEGASETLVRIIPEKTTVTCLPEPDGTVRQVSIIATIETSYVDEDGETHVIFPELKVPLPHYSSWVVEDGTWKVSQER